MWNWGNISLVLIILKILTLPGCNKYDSVNLILLCYLKIRETLLGNQLGLIITLWFPMKKFSKEVCALWSVACLAKTKRRKQAKYRNKKTVCNCLNLIILIQEKSFLLMYSLVSSNFLLASSTYFSPTYKQLTYLLWGIYITPFYNTQLL